MVYQVKFEDYGYANARVRAMKSLLLSEEFYARLLSIDDPKMLFETLEKTPYKTEIEEVSLLKTTMAEIIDEALKRNMAKTFSKVATFVAGEAGRLVKVLLARWDLHNLKTILRGRHIGASEEEIKESLIPASELNEPLLNELARAVDIGTVVDLLATWEIPYARPLVESLPKYLARKELLILELALDKFYYERVLQESQGNSLHARIVRDLMLTEIDIRNLITLLRLQGVKFEFTGKKEEIEKQVKEQIETLFVPGGKEIKLTKFVDLAQKKDVEAVIRELRNTSYGSVLRSGMDRYKETNSLSVLERKLEEYSVQKAITSYRRGPLCIGIIVGYLWMKFREVVNLRIITRCKLMGMPERKIREEIILA